ncbi:MAG: SCP2 sterol-binding domain-containing protein [Acidimicrobiia bacterium]|nr:SCP2 sterol-binding domain-containing protein [Acidimicrobiia bacterium]
MPDVYTMEWYEAVQEAINAAVAKLADVPSDAFTIAVEIEGDGASPYVAGGAVRRFLIRLEGGQCVWYREVEADDPSVRLDYRFTGPASTFDGIAAGLVDPIDAALTGTIRVRGDMRFLMRQAEMVQVLLEAYAKGVETTWPQGRPPYSNGSS